MRICALALVLLGGCYDGLAPPPFNLDGGPDLSASVLPDLLGSDGGGPMSCTTACDCTPGDRCKMGTCETAAVKVFCCGTADCTGSNVCQQPGGGVSQCGLNGDAAFTPTDASVAGCAGQACQKGVAGTILCKLACGTAAADCVGNAGSGEHCQP